MRAELLQLASFQVLHEGVVGCLNAFSVRLGWGGRRAGAQIDIHELANRLHQSSEKEFLTSETDKILPGPCQPGPSTS